MPTIIMTRWPVKLDGSVKAKAMTFLQKLSADDTTPGLHVEPIRQSVDSRVRTGRVDDSYRAVMFRLDGSGETHYVIHGVWQHDEAIAIAGRLRLKVNPVNGLPQIEEATPLSAVTQAPAVQFSVDSTLTAPTAIAPPPDVAAVQAVAAQPLLERLGHSREALVDRLGVPAAVADAAMAATDEDAVLQLAQRHEGWLGLMLVDLATGDSIETIVARMEIEEAPDTGDEDEDLLTSLKRSAAQAQFSFIEDQEELRRVIESGDFGAWRIFLHPAQRRYVEKSFSGPFRLSGGAGTGKTVVLVHRARALARQEPGARIVMTTFTTNLADALRDGLTELDPRMPIADGLGRPGVRICGVDALAAEVIRAAGAGISEAVHTVLGDVRNDLTGRVPSARWRAIVDAAHTTLPTEVANDTFLAAEYTTVILPNRIRTEDEYLRVRRPGRGTALDRAKRRAVWALVAAYRAQNRIDGQLDFAEAVTVAAAYLESAGTTPRHLADHVLVDEGQDLSPGHWQLLRALVAPGKDDLFIAEDSHQRIYGARVVLGRYGIRIVGRSQRLTLNYRTTAQNLRYAMTVLEGGSYLDLEDNPESTGYRSARSGPAPTVVDVASIGAELATAAKFIEGWLSQNTPPETIAVLVRDRYQRDRVVVALADRGIGARAVDRDRPGVGRVLVMTMHRAKGLEFSKVVLAGMVEPESTRRAAGSEADDAETLEAELRDRSLIYVAATRARDELVVLRRR
ncbi:UvrD/REP helicase N-terminal domain-containing protein [Sanguibacter gelidistatuariae]|uniref:DNA 3'-5' helicase n=1 Tax=Sanguibacter gelidistatuariae TaxID=1814289 RepID=A0A1G6SUJ2_9MICO|nr:UvrD-helicase domain-containing protein [Sanguibacter gelidistatuariae]SDD20448.1 UvrD/REP helicase N-terminal domain-containing protein [Sanguibacter gelidistatuariae]